MITHCPGSRSLRTPELRAIRCVQCGGLVEIFSDERESRCLKCGNVIYSSPNHCADWCARADICLGRTGTAKA